MSDSALQSAGPTFKVYPESVELLVKACKSSSLPVRQAMIGLMQYFDRISIDSFDAFKEKLQENYTFPSDHEAETFYKAAEDLRKIGKITHYVIVSDADMKTAVQEALDSLPSGSAYKKMIEAAKDETFSFHQFDIYELALHLLYYSNVIVPLGDPAVGYGINFEKEVNGRLSVQLQNAAKNYGADALVPFILFNEWQVDGLLKLTSSIPDLKKTIDQQNAEIDQLRKDVAGFKAQSNGSSQYTWEA